ncbi:MAG: DinB family protein [Thermoanaerobaculia bacterium]|nr:DinB family protein [Thermoanaerobaculia bacterium]
MSVSWSDLLRSRMEESYHMAEGLLPLVDDSSLGWKPSDGDNWMTVGQLLRHIADACGKSCRGFVSGDWGLPEGFAPEDLPAEEMIPPAEALPAVASVAEAAELLATDREIAFALLAQAQGRLDEPTRAPWDPREKPLGMRMLEMVEHLDTHKNQLFYYLKLQGKPVNTLHMYGMA